MMRWPYLVILGLFVAGAGAGCAQRDQRVSRQEALGVVTSLPPLPVSRQEIRFIPVGSATANGQWLLPLEFDPREVALIHGPDVADALLSMPVAESPALRLKQQ